VAEGTAATPHMACRRSPARTRTRTNRWHSCRRQCRRARRTSALPPRTSSPQALAGRRQRLKPTCCRRRRSSQACTRTPSRWLGYTAAWRRRAACSAPAAPTAAGPQVAPVGRTRWRSCRPRGTTGLAQQPSQVRYTTSGQQAQHEQKMQQTTTTARTATALRQRRSAAATQRAQRPAAPADSPSSAARQLRLRSSSCPRTRFAAAPSS
jgi:hypothetical protein